MSQQDPVDKFEPYAMAAILSAYEAEYGEEERINLENCLKSDNTSLELEEKLNKLFTQQEGQLALQIISGLTNSNV